MNDLRLVKDPSHSQTRRQLLKSAGSGVVSASTLSSSLFVKGINDGKLSMAQTDFHSQIFSSGARWIWDDSNRWAYHRYLQARQRFPLGAAEVLRITRGKGATLRITADAYYQAWLNGKIIGQGPAKSAEGRRSVDSWPITGLLVRGDNELVVIALCLGGGTMTYCPGEAGLIFETDLGEAKIASGDSTEVKPDPTRQNRTARRWMQPCLGDVNGAAEDSAWHPATVVEKSSGLYARRVPLPSRKVLVPNSSGMGKTKRED